MSFWIKHGVEQGSLEQGARHTFQLIFKDLFKSSPVVQKAAFTTRIVRLLRCRELQYDLYQLIDSDGEVHRKRINVPQY